jgi:hypothetical protein
MLAAVYGLGGENVNAEELREFEELREATRDGADVRPVVARLPRTEAAGEGCEARATVSRSVAANSVQCLWLRSSAADRCLRSS